MNSIEFPPAPTEQARERLCMACDKILGQTTVKTSIKGNTHGICQSCLDAYNELVSQRMVNKPIEAWSQELKQQQKKAGEIQQRTNQEYDQLIKIPKAKEIIELIASSKPWAEKQELLKAQAGFLYGQIYFSVDNLTQDQLPIITEKLRKKFNLGE